MKRMGVLGVGNLRMSLILMTVSLLGGTIEWFVVVVMYGFFCMFILNLFNLFPSFVYTFFFFLYRSLNIYSLRFLLLHFIFIILDFHYVT